MTSQIDETLTEGYYRMPSHREGILKEVTLQEASSDLAKLVADVEAGAEVVITRDGLPLARVFPYPPTVRRDAEWEATLAQLMDWMEHGVSLGGERMQPGKESFPADFEQPGLMAKIKPILDRFSALPDLDTRSPDEIIGYDETGLPR